MAEHDVKPRSREVTDGMERAAARGMLRAVGMDDEDFTKPQIGIASSWNEITPCNLSLDRLAEADEPPQQEGPAGGEAGRRQHDQREGGGARGPVYGAGAFLSSAAIAGTIACRSPITA